MFGARIGIITISTMDNKEQQSTGNDPDALEKPTDLNALDALSKSGDSESGGLASDKSLKTGTASKGGRLRKLWRSVNVYLLIFLLLIVIAGIVFVVSYLNSQQEPEVPTTALQDLSQEELEEIATGDATVGDPRYTLNIQSDAVFAGSALIRGDLNVAGSVQLGQPLTVPAISVSGTSNLSTVQINTLSVAGAVTLQSALTLNDDAVISGNLDVGGNSTFNGTLTASSIITGSLTITGSSIFTVSNPIRTSGTTPGRTNGGALGGGGTSSVSGSTTAGRININTGTSPQPGCLVTINFSQALPSVPYVMVTPVGADAGRLDFYTNRTNTSFSVCTANAANAGRSFGFDYFVVN